MTAWPAMADKWVSYNNDAMHFSPKRRSPIFQSFTVRLPQLTCALYRWSQLRISGHVDALLPAVYSVVVMAWPTSRPLAVSGHMHWRGWRGRERERETEEAGAMRCVVNTVCGPLTPLM